MIFVSYSVWTNGVEYIEKHSVVKIYKKILIAICMIFLDNNIQNDTLSMCKYNAGGLSQIKVCFNNNQIWHENAVADEMLTLYGLRNPTALYKFCTLVLTCISCANCLKLRRRASATTARKTFCQKSNKTTLLRLLLLSACCRSDIVICFTVGFKCVVKFGCVMDG